jgi:hypothetical protein
MGAGAGGASTYLAWFRLKVFNFIKKFENTLIFHVLQLQFKVRLTKPFDDYRYFLSSKSTTILGNHEN